MIIGASNELKGTVVFVHEGAVNGLIGIELKSGEIVTASLTMDSVMKLDLKVGDTASAFVKATDVIVAKEE